MVDATFVLNLVEAVGILVGVSIAIMEIRKSREERQMQFSLQYLEKANSLELLDHWLNFLNNMDFSTYEEWSEKYGPHADPEATKHLYSLMNFHEYMGKQAMDGFLDLDMVLDRVTPVWASIVYEKSLPLINEWRKRYNYPLYEGFEFLYNELKKKYPDFPYAPSPIQT